MATYFLDIENADRPLRIERLHVGDNGIRTLLFRFLKGGKHFDLPKDCTATLYAILPDKSRIYDSCAVEGDTVIYTLKGGTLHPSLTSREGESLCEIRLTFPDGNIITSPSFSVFCDRVIQNDEAIEASESFTALTDALSRVEAMENDVAHACHTLIFDSSHTSDEINLDAFEHIFESHRRGKDISACLRYSDTGSITAPAFVYVDDPMDLCIVSAKGADLKTIYFIVYTSGELDYRTQSVPDGTGDGGGATFTPSVSEDGIISWTNDKGLENPQSVNIKGDDGKSAYDYALDGGYTGSVKEFSDSLASLSEKSEYIEATGWGALMTYGGYINSDGELTEHTRYITSDYIEAVTSTDIVYSRLRGVNKSGYIIAAYDESKTFLPDSSVYINDASENAGVGVYLSGTYTVPEGVAYVRLVDWWEKQGSFTYTKKIESASGDDPLDGSQWRGKKLYAFGTSLTDTTYMNEETGEVTGRYLPYLSQLGQLEVTDYGIAGGTIATGGLYNASGNILSKILETDVSDADLITIEGFVNDFACAVSIGEVTDTENTTLCGAIYNAVKHCLEKSSATVVLITDSTGKKYTLSSTGGTADYSVSKKNSLDLLQSDYNNAIIKMGQYMGVPVIDAGGISHINCFRPSYIIDQIHHTDEGGRQYALAIWSGLKGIGLSQPSVPVEDEPDTLALWDMAERTELTAKDAGVNITASVPNQTIAGATARSIPYDKYIRGSSVNGNWNFGTALQPVVTVDGDNSFTMQIIESGCGLGMPLKLEAQKSYRLSYNASTGHRVYATYFNENGVYQQNSIIVSSDNAGGSFNKTFTVSDYPHFQLTFSAGVKTVSFTDIVLEEA